MQFGKLKTATASSLMVVVNMKLAVSKPANLSSPKTLRLGGCGFKESVGSHTHHRKINDSDSEIVSVLAWCR